MNQFKDGYAVIIGVDQTPGQELPAVAKDVKALAGVLLSPQHCAYQEDNVKVVTGDQATGRNILAALDWLENAVSNNPRSTAFVYFSGHGARSTSKNFYFLIPHDFNPKRAMRTAISADEFASQLLAIQSDRVLIILDCCHAEGIGAKEFKIGESFQTEAFPLNLDGVKSLPTFEPGSKSVSELAKGTGRVILNSSTKEERSYVRRDQKMSIFTYHLIEALTGHAPHDDADKTVLTSDVMSWVTRKVAPSAKADWHQPQNPDMRADGAFSIAMLAGGKGVAMSKGEKAVDPFEIEAAIPNSVYNINVGRGAAAIGDGAIAVGERGVNVGGNVGGNIVTGDGNMIKDESSKIEIGSITGSTGVAIGPGASATVNQGASGDQLEKLFTNPWASARESPVALARG